MAKLYVSTDSNFYSVKKDTVEKCLRKIIKMNGYELERSQKGLTVDELLKHIDECNGDGCDYIISIIDLEQGLVIYHI